MAPEIQTFDPESDLTFILTRPPSPSISTELVGSNEPSLHHKTPAKSEHIHFLVSSKHMKMASSVFKAMLSGPFNEGETLAATGKVEISLPEDDPVAFTILMNIIHHRSRAVPRKITLKSLVAVAILTDKYEFHQDVETYGEIWLKALKLAVEVSDLSVYDVFSWLSVAWVFRRQASENHLSRLIKEIVLNRTWDDDDDPRLEAFAEGFPLLPQRLIETLQQQRQTAIGEALNIVEIVAMSFKGPSVQCVNEDPQCDAIALGNFLKFAMEIGVFPAPKAPYAGLSFSDIAKELGGLNFVTGCQHPDKNHKYRDWRRIKGLVKSSLTKVKETRKGLDLSAFNCGKVWTWEVRITFKESSSDCLNHSTSNET
ncbi:hypothetical protein LOCC1_G003391 [Lachnellula occidentalis]|uniref:BTB domain-containing protein n=1 Tax=Lachnellula occidentalis TaxID=215460 RepID=A0A8H8UJE5_9HELO|nr:hypothetical protein LOCC1_G003391 [Lachnellula occidentalis]